MIRIVDAHPDQKNQTFPCLYGRERLLEGLARLAEEHYHGLRQYQKRALRSNPPTDAPDVIADGIEKHYRVTKALENF